MRIRKANGNDAAMIAKVHIGAQLIEVLCQRNILQPSHTNNANRTGSKYSNVRASKLTLCSSLRMSKGRLSHLQGAAESVVITRFTMESYMPSTFSKLISSGTWALLSSNPEPPTLGNET